jgi:hypothetical protein
MSCIHRRSLSEAASVIVHTVVTVLVMVTGAFGTFEMFGGTVRASEGSTRGCPELIEDRRQLRVRLVPKKNINAAMVETVKREVVELWRDYGVDIVWEGRWEIADPDNKPELFVHFVDRELEAYSHRGPSAVAWILFLDGVPGNLINVSVAAADRLLQDSPWLDGRPVRVAPQEMQENLIATMTGRALAHEIGHYLLASSKHAKEGLMKPLITPSEFVKISRRHLKLMPEDVRALRAAHLAACQLSVSR